MRWRTTRRIVKIKKGKWEKIKDPDYLSLFKKGKHTIGSYKTKYGYNTHINYTLDDTYPTPKQATMRLAQLKKKKSQALYRRVKKSKTKK